MLVALTRVTVGKTECDRVYQTPPVFSRFRFGVSAGVTESGRRPSITRTITSAGRPAGWATANGAASDRHVNRRRSRILIAFLGRTSLRFYLIDIFCISAPRSDRRRLPALAPLTS